MRRTRRPSPTSQAVARPAATASTRSTAAPPTGRCSGSSSASQRAHRPAGERRAALRRARGRRWGRASAASASSRSSSSRSRSAWRARIGTRSRPARSASSGSSSWRTRLRRKRGSRVRRVVDGRRARAPRTRQSVSVRRSARIGRLPAAGPHRRQARAAEPRSRLQQHRLGLVVGGVAGEHVGRQRGVAGGAGAGLEVRAVGHVDASTRRSRHAERGGRARARRRPRSAEPARRPWSTWMAVASQPAATASASSAVESAPPGHGAGDRGARARERAAREQRREQLVPTRDGDRIAGRRRRSVLAAVLLARVRCDVTRLQVPADEGRPRRRPTASVRSDADPPVPDVRREHGGSVATDRSARQRAAPDSLAGRPISRRRQSSPKQLLDLGQQTGRHLVVAALLRRSTAFSSAWKSNACRQSGQPLEVGADRRRASSAELVVEERLELSQGLVAVSHGSVLPLRSVVGSARASEMSPRACG